MRCTQPGCAGSIVDGYCDVCGMTAESPATSVISPRFVSSDTNATIG